MCAPVTPYQDLPSVPFAPGLQIYEFTIPWLGRTFLLLALCYDVKGFTYSQPELFPSFLLVHSTSEAMHVDLFSLI